MLLEISIAIKILWTQSNFLIARFLEHLNGNRGLVILIWETFSHKKITERLFPPRRALRIRWIFIWEDFNFLKANRHNSDDFLILLLGPYFFFCKRKQYLMREIKTERYLWNTFLKAYGNVQTVRNCIYKGL